MAGLGRPRTVDAVVAIGPTVEKFGTAQHLHLNEDPTLFMIE